MDGKKQRGKLEGSTVPQSNIMKKMKIDYEIAQYSAALEKIDQESRFGLKSHDDLAAMTEKAMVDMWAAADAYEREVGGDINLIRDAQRSLRFATDRFFSQCAYHRARTWPRGYQGDYEMLEFHYRNEPGSQGVGHFLENYLLQCALAAAVRERKDLLKDMLDREMAVRKNPSVMDIACGPCREIVEMSEAIKRAGASFICVDHDPEALEYSRDRMMKIAFPMNKVQFRQYNALKMVNHERNVQEFGAQDIIYSVGLFDYLSDDVLVKLLRSLHDLLKPGGILIASFKDCSRYSTFIYHWLVEWNAFLQRKEQDVLALYERAGFPPEAVMTTRTASEVIVFYNASK
jgi:extracellular factor (EF) 3-hydroxypalmitic acid methyl ester biosynthesis protein